MSYIIIHTTSKEVSRALYKLEKTNKNLFVLNLTEQGRHRSTKVMRNNGVVLSYISRLLQAHPNEVYVWVADRLTLRDFPEKCKEGGKWLSQGKRNLRHVPKAIGMTKEELEKIKLNYELKEK